MFRVVFPCSLCILAAMLGPQVCVYYRCFHLPLKQLAPVPLSEFVSVYDEVYSYILLDSSNSNSLVSSFSVCRCSWIYTSSWSVNLICNANLSFSNSRNRSSSSSSAYSWDLSSANPCSLVSIVTCTVKGASNSQFLGSFGRHLFGVQSPPSAPSRPVAPHKSVIRLYFFQSFPQFTNLVAASFLSSLKYAFTHLRYTYSRFPGASANFGERLGFRLCFHFRDNIYRKFTCGTTDYIQYVKIELPTKHRQAVMQKRRMQ